MKTNNQKSDSSCFTATLLLDILKLNLELGYLKIIQGNVLKIKSCSIYCSRTIVMISLCDQEKCAVLGCFYDELSSFATIAIVIF